MFSFTFKCQEFATQYVGRMTEQFQRLGVLGEWENPYITLLPEFEAKISFRILFMAVPMWILPLA